jgi:hypothetical protein
MFSRKNIWSVIASKIDMIKMLDTQQGDQAQ